MALHTTPFEVLREGVTLSGQEVGEGEPVVLLHGLTATRRYVLMGSTQLQRGGRRVISYDARGHGESSPAPNHDAYTYDHLSRDLEALLDARGVERAVLVGASMGAHTAVRFALQRPARVVALALITPAFEPERFGLIPDAFASWDALARGLRERGVEGFVDAYDFSEVPPAWRETVERVVRQRLAAHEHPLALADALEVLPRSQPFSDMDELAEITVPTLVIASRDEADPGHPLAIGERYAAVIPTARLVVEDEGPPTRSPIAWQGGQLSKLVAALT